MSAISGDPFKAQRGLDVVRRYRTTCKVRVDSHRFTEPLYLSDDVRAIQTGKTIKGPGRATLQLVANRNWLNYLAPNDIINIYFNIGDGEGWTRTFFGYIDRVEESYAVSADGKPTTTYRVVCSDFYKAFEQTQIYFNPHLAGRNDLDGAFFGTPNIGGLALQTQGVKVFGAPSDLVINLVLLMVGFGTQWTLPESYQPLLKNKLREQRAAFITEGLKLSDFAQESLDGGTFQDLVDNIREQSEGLAQDVANAGDSKSERLTRLAKIVNADNADTLDVNVNDHEAVSRYIADYRYRQEVVLADPARASNDDRGALTILNSTLDSAPPSLLDVVDPITFVERRAMDGYHAATSVWQRQGTLISLIRSMSHEIMNELLFDLRPVTSPGDESFDGNTLLAKEYSRGPDEIQENIGSRGEQNGVQYIPAMVMREYPFSTITGVSLNASEILGGRTKAQTAFLGNVPESQSFYLWFGAIWQDRPNEPGRHVINIPNINWADYAEGEPQGEGYKHLDVAVISESELIRSQLGKSDKEHFNLMEFWVDGLLGTDQRFYMHDLLPVITPIQIMRNGLRVRSLTTRFARFSIDIAARVKVPAAPAEQAAVAESEEAAETPEEVTGPFNPHSEGELSRTREGLKRTPYVPSRGGIPHTNSGVSISSGYDVASKSPDKIRSDFSSAGISSADPVVVLLAGAPGTSDTGASGLRGIAAQNYLDANSPLPSLSASEEVAFFEVVRAGALQRAKLRTTGTAVTGNPRTDAFVNADDPITTTQFDALHPRVQEFLADLGLGSIISGQRVNTITDIIRTDPSEPIVMLQRFKDFTRSLPDSRQQARGRQIRLRWLNAKIDELTAAATTASEEEAGVTPAQASETAGSTSGIAVDSSLVRRQVVRWALLNDLWYQHNLEYLNGTLEMRGAPEIRVGYRLDIAEKNMSFYTEGVNHSWQFPGRMSTSITVTRGQPNNPYPLYVLPPLNVYNSRENQRKLASGRLAAYFLVPDPLAVRRGVVLRQPGAGQNRVFQQDPVRLNLTDTGGNYVDSPEYARNYGEAVILPGGTTAPNAPNEVLNDEEIAAAFEVNEGRELGREDGFDNPSGVSGTNVDNQIPGDPPGPE